jgi:hypothetical protein
MDVDVRRFAYAQFCPSVMVIALFVNHSVLVWYRGSCYCTVLVDSRQTIAS